MRRIHALAVAFATAGFAGAAYGNDLGGQPSGTTNLTPYNVAFRLGAALPFDSALTNYGSPLIDMGVEYTFSRSLLPTGDTYISVDYFTRNLSFADGVVPICINQRFYAPSNTNSRPVYGFVGVGMAIIAIGPSNTVVAGRAGVGSDLSDNVFFEIAGTISDRGSTARADAVTFSLGYRF